MGASDPLESEIAALEATVERLLATVERLSEENRGLRHSQEQLTGERASLMTRNEHARSRVEAMIERLKALENNS
jgi:cell division protein ZapB